MKNNIKNIIQILVLFLLQILVFNNLNVNGYINPYIYPLILLILPFDIQGWALLLIAFCIGFIEDLFLGTLGMHTFSLVLMAGLIPFANQLFSLQKAEQAKQINIKSHGLMFVITYFGLMLLVYNLCYFSIEAWNFSGFWHTTLRIILSTLTSTLICTLLLLVFNAIQSNER